MDTTKVNGVCICRQCNKTFILYRYQERRPNRGLATLIGEGRRWIEARAALAMSSEVLAANYKNCPVALIKRNAILCSRV